MRPALVPLAASASGGGTAPAGESLLAAFA